MVIFVINAMTQNPVGFWVLTAGKRSRPSDVLD
jgi:hypothetical protein